MADKRFKRIDLSPFLRFQKNISRLVNFKKLDRIKRIVCVDVGYKENLAVGVAVLYDLEKKDITNVYFEKNIVAYPYIPGFLFLREAPVVLSVLKKIREKYELIIIDGHGLAHPRKSGLATVIGVITKKPTIGIAKKFLYGKIRDNFIYVGGRKVGLKVGKYYVSIGSNIDFSSLIRFLKIIDFEYPKAMKIADKLSKYLAKKLKA
ncbi:MAG: endonuclease V [Candidatus Aenigmarchaeota archaeon]|nr:endonuclease V [Candidatus Aenigmarchaeota archaeon]MDW8160050.1 endonuclease V [Candidatus Aenigmarchaeota archaeon]